MISSPAQPSPVTRRHFLWQAGSGIGGIALTWLLHQDRVRAGEGPAAISSGRGGLPLPHFPPRAKRVVHIYACGGVSHLDTFDYKPELAKHDGKELTGKGKVDTFFGQPGRLMKSPFAFAQHGQTGAWVSDLLPHLAGCVDDITFIHSMVSKSSNHTPATFQMNTGFTMNGFPCLGSWLSYALGSENQDLPAFVVLPDPRQLPAGGAINWTSGFLPAVHQGVAFRSTGAPIADLATPAGTSEEQRRRAMAFLRETNESFAELNPIDTALAARLRAYELAARMQTSIPETSRLESEPASVRELYGLNREVTAGFGRNCLLARRLLERGVRFVQLFHGGAFGSPRINWDGHENIIENHQKQALGMDRPVAALLKDLKARGMLDDTLVLWTTEFGRTPITQGIGSKGRDHHPNVFTIWMAGAGLKPGIHYGASDEVGYAPAQQPVSVYDFHATVLHLLGLNHEQLTFYHNGIQRRLTDVHGETIRQLLS